GRAVDLLPYTVVILLDELDAHLGNIARNDTHTAEHRGILEGILGRDLDVLLPRARERLADQRIPSAAVIHRGQRLSHEAARARQGPAEGVHSGLLSAASRRSTSERSRGTRHIWCGFLPARLS